MRVFVENEAGSRVKHHHDEKTFEPLGTEIVGHPYPFPYGFVVGTTGGDGDNVDCFILTMAPLRSGDVVECVPVALLEQTEGGLEDHNLLAVPAGAPAVVPPGAVDRIREHILLFRAGRPGPEAVPGRLLGRQAAEDYLEGHRDRG